MQELLAQPAALPGPTLSRQPTGGSLETASRGPAVGTPEGRASTALRGCSRMPRNRWASVVSWSPSTKRTRVRVRPLKRAGVYSIACAQMISCPATSIIRETRSATGCQQACRASVDPMRGHTRLPWPSVAVSPLCSRSAIQFASLEFSCAAAILVPRRLSLTAQAPPFACPNSRCRPIAGLRIVGPS